MYLNIVNTEKRRLLNADLMNALMSFDFSKVEGIIDSGADVNFIHPYTGKSAIFLAIDNGEPWLVSLLLRKGADPDLKNREGNAPIHHTLLWQHHGVSLSNILLDHGADTEITNGEVLPLLHWASKYGREVAVDNFLIRGFDVNKVDCFGSTPLHYAIESGHIAVADKLIKSGASIEVKNNEGSTALHSLCKSGLMSKKTTLKIIEGSRDLDFENKNGESPLYLSLDNSNIFCFTELLKAGAKITDGIPEYAEMESRKTAVRKFLLMHLVAFGARFDDTEFLSKSLRISPLRAACTLGLTKRAVELISMGGKIKEGRGKSLIDVAIQNGHLETAEAMQSAVARMAIEQMMSKEANRALRL